MNCIIEGCEVDFSESHLKLSNGSLLKANKCRACQGLERLHRYRLRKGIKPPSQFRYLMAQVAMENYERERRNERTAADVAAIYNRAA